MCDEGAARAKRLSRWEAQARTDGEGMQIRRHGNQKKGPEPVLSDLQSLTRHSMVCMVCILKESRHRSLQRILSPWVCTLELWGRCPRLIAVEHGRALRCGASSPAHWRLQAFMRRRQ